MERFTTHEGTAAPLPLANVSTDVIIRIDRLTSISRDKLGPYALEPLRYLEDGSVNPEFVLNTPEWKDSTILVVGPNFGCGSSREGAVWALQGAGIRCIVGTTFGEIFHENCFKNGLLVVSLSEPDFERVLEQASQARPVAVDLLRTEIYLEGDVLPFRLDAWRRQSLLEGLDAVELALLSTDAIRQWQAADRLRRPWVWINNGDE